MGQKVTHVHGSGRVILLLDFGWSEVTVTPSDPLIASLHCTKHKIKGCLHHKLLKLMSLCTGVTTVLLQKGICKHDFEAVA